jgi:hypothetical protein
VGKAFSNTVLKNRCKLLGFNLLLSIDGVIDGFQDATATDSYVSGVLGHSWYREYLGFLFAGCVEGKYALVDVEADDQSLRSA